VSEIIAASVVSGDQTKKQPIAVQALTIFKEIERRYARFS
jgi:hypothetical protein